MIEFTSQNEDSRLSVFYSNKRLGVVIDEGDGYPYTFELEDKEIDELIQFLLYVKGRSHFPRRAGDSSF